MLLLADSPTIWNRPGRRRTISSVWVPIEPVEPRITKRFMGLFFGDGAKLSHPSLVVEQGFHKVLAGKFRPADGRHIDFTVSRFPEQKVGEAKLTGGADQQVGVGNIGPIEVICDGLFVNGFGAKLSFLHAPGDGAHGIYHLGTAAVV